MRRTSGRLRAIAPHARERTDFPIPAWVSGLKTLERSLASVVRPTRLNAFLCFRRRSVGPVFRPLSPLREQFTNGWDQVVRNFHECLGWIFPCGFILRNGFLFCQCLIMIENPFDPMFIPPFWKFALHHYLRPPLRLCLYALSGFPFSSYAVITKTLFGSGSGTYMTRRYRPAIVCPMATRAPSFPGRSSPGHIKTSATSFSSTSCLRICGKFVSGSM